MTPAEACLYMADPANWYDATFTAGVELKWPGTGKDGPWNAQKLAAMALSDTAEIVNTAPTESRHESRPCVECHEAIMPGEAYTLRPNGYPIHARHAPRR